MKPSLIKLFSLLLIAFLFSCDGPFDKKMIIGEWNGVEWLVQGQTSDIDASSASFAFKDDGTYSYTYADATETGKYFISRNELITTPDGGIKMMVKIVKLTPDSLIFNMNRGGTAETLTLLRK